MIDRLLLVACLGSTLYMAGVIVFVDWVHYPLFEHVGIAGFERYHAEHVRRTTWVVALPMLVELLASAGLLVWRPVAAPGWMLWLGLILALSTWAITGAASVPMHGRLALGFDALAHRTLVTTNRLRVLAWTLHAAVLLTLTYRALRPSGASV